MTLKGVSGFNYFVERLSGEVTVFIERTTKLKDGQEYWSIADDGQWNSPDYRRPWKGKISKNRSCTYLFNTDEFADIITKVEYYDLYLTEVDAWQAYLMRKQQELDVLAEEIAFAKNKLKGPV